ncbi:MAG TPA: ribonuclease III domain-containing protein [Tissierellaceae bacterium]|nr:ribonuclease III domain-containing protein [Tissierellaceae bacterium]
MSKKNIFRNINESLTEEDVKMLQPLQLAYVGDAVYELLVRTFLLDGNQAVNQLHKKATRLVKAQSQASIVHKLEDYLTDKEKTIVRQGRNAKSSGGSKNVDLINYKYATGFEALMGYLYLTGQEERLSSLFEKIISLKID